ncbi:hypothetical protein Tco_0218893 [Tanacetum coccineum]
MGSFIPSCHIRCFWFRLTWHQRFAPISYTSSGGNIGPVLERKRHWESGMRVNIRDFSRDTLSPEGFIDWLVTGIRVVASIETNNGEGWKAMDHELAEDEELIARNDIQEIEDQLFSRYIGGLRVQIIDSVNMFDPMTLSDAYQRALAFKKQNRRVGSSSSPAITGAFGSGNVASRFAPSQAKAECKKADKRHLFANLEGDDDAAYEEYEEALVYDEQLEYEEEYVSRDVGSNLVVRHSCLIPIADGDAWLKHNIFQSTCTISDLISYSGLRKAMRGHGCLSLVVGQTLGV